MEALVSQLVGRFERGTLTRRQLVQSLAALVAWTPTVSEAQGGAEHFRSVRVDHLSFQVADYARTRDFYSELMGLTVSHDEPAAKQCRLHVGESFIIARTARPGRTPPAIDHFAVAISDWNKPRVEAVLKRRSLRYTPDQQWPDDSFHVRDPDGYDLQIVNDKVKA